MNNYRMFAASALGIVLTLASITICRADTAAPPAPPMAAPPPSLLANGTPAPDFTVQDSSGNPVHLSDFKGKVVVIDFWATWCGPCQASLPHTNAVAKQFKDQNVVILGVNTADTKQNFESWLPKHKDYDSIDFVIDSGPRGKNISNTLYKVYGIPTQYVVDRSGNISASFVGYGGPTPDLENAIKAALAPITPVTPVIPAQPTT